VFHRCAVKCLFFLRFVRKRARNVPWDFLPLRAICEWVTTRATNSPIQKSWQASENLPIATKVWRGHYLWYNFWENLFEETMDRAKRIANIEALLVETPDDPELRYMLAMEYAGGGDDAEAVRRFEELISVAPDYPPAYHQAGRSLQRLNRIADARAMLQRGIPVAQRQGNSHAAGEMMELLQNLE